MIVPLTRTGRRLLAQAVARLLADPDPAQARAMFRRLPDADRARLLAAEPADVLVTAARAYRMENPSMAADFRAGLLVLNSRKVCPTIARAQAEERARA